MLIALVKAVNLMTKFTLADYAAMDTSSLSLEDVKQDSEYVQRHNPFGDSDYIGITGPALRTLRRGNDSDKAAFVDALASYFLDGEPQDLDLVAQVSDKAATAIDIVVSGHEARTRSDILKKYKQFVGGKAKAAAAAGITIEERDKGF